MAAARAFYFVFKTFASICFAPIRTSTITSNVALSPRALLTACWSDTVRVLSTSASVSKRWGHKSNWLRENLPLRIPALTLMVYMLFSSRSTMTPSKFRGSPQPLSTMGIGTAKLTLFYTDCTFCTTLL